MSRNANVDKFKDIKLKTTKLAIKMKDPEIKNMPQLKFHMFQRSVCGIFFCENAESKTSFIPSRARNVTTILIKTAQASRRSCLINRDDSVPAQSLTLVASEESSCENAGEHLAAGHPSRVIVRVWITRVFPCTSEHAGESESRLENQVSDNWFVCFDECVSPRDRLSTACSDERQEIVSELQNSARNRRAVW